MRDGFAVVLVGVFSIPGRGQDERVFSGPQPGEKLGSFKAHAVFGPESGKEIELATTGKPTLLIFVHEVTRPAFQLIRPVDHYATSLSKMGLDTHFVWLTADKSKTEQFLQTAKKSLSLKSPVAISSDGIEGPGSYGLNRKVTLTILVGKDQKVTANFAIVQPNETDVPKVVEAVAKLMGQKAPTLAQLQAELKPGGRPAAKPDAKGQSPELQKLMRQMIQKTNDEATVKRVADDMAKWAGDDAKKQAELRDYCRLIVRLGYGTEAAQRELKRLAGESK